MRATASTKTPGDPPVPRAELHTSHAALPLVPPSAGRQNNPRRQKPADGLAAAPERAPERQGDGCSLKLPLGGGHRTLTRTSTAGTVQIALPDQWNQSVPLTQSSRATVPQGYPSAPQVHAQEAWPRYRAPPAPTNAGNSVAARKREKRFSSRIAASERVNHSETPGCRKLQCQARRFRVTRSPSAGGSTLRWAAQAVAARSPGSAGDWLRRPVAGRSP